MPVRSGYHLMSDEELMRKIARRDSQAFSVLYDRYSGPLFTYFVRMLWKDREKARDFTQELFTRIIQKPESFDPSRIFKTWMYSVAHNMCKNEYARHEVRTNAHEEIRGGETGITLSDGGKDLDREAFQAKLSEALAGLDEVRRTTFELRFYQELSILEISEVMQCSEGTVKSRLFYILKELNQKLRVFQHILRMIPLLVSFPWL